MKKHSKAATHDASLKRLSRISGQVLGIRRMVEERRYCMDIVTQLQAARAALRAVELQILRKHVSHCVAAALASGTKKEAGKKMDELMAVLKKQ